MKYEGTKVDIVNDIQGTINDCQRKYKDSPEALKAIEEIEDTVAWWMNTPTVWRDMKPAGFYQSWDYSPVYAAVQWVKRIWAR